jgi:hypothetical protein
MGTSLVPGSGETGQSLPYNRRDAATASLRCVRTQQTSDTAPTYWMNAKVSMVAAVIAAPVGLK